MKWFRCSSCCGKACGKCNRNCLWGEFAVRPGDTIPCLPEYDPEVGLWNWYLEETGEIFDITTPVLEDMRLILKKTE